jgi:hypothetical protein
LDQTVEIIAGMQAADDRQIGETMVAIGLLLRIAEIHAAA